MKLWCRSSNKIISLLDKQWTNSSEMIPRPVKNNYKSLTTKTNNLIWQITFSSSFARFNRTNSLKLWRVWRERIQFQIPWYIDLNYFYSWEWKISTLIWTYVKNLIWKLRFIWIFFVALTPLQFNEFMKRVCVCERDGRKHIKLKVCRPVVKNGNLSTKSE